MKILSKRRFGRRGILSPGDIRRHFFSNKAFDWQPVGNIWRLSVANQKDSEELKEDFH